MVTIIFIPLRYEVRTFFAGNTFWDLMLSDLVSVN